MSELTLVEKEQLDKYIAAVHEMTTELENAGIIDLSKYSVAIDRHTSYWINHNKGEEMQILKPVINAKNNQSVFNASQIALIKKYRGDYDSSSGYWYVRLYLHTEF